MTSSAGRLLREARRRVLLHRRLLAALAAAGAVVLGLQAARPQPEPTATVWAAAHDLAGGAVLQAGDLRRVGLPRDAVPSRPASARLLRDAVLAAPVRAGEPLTDLSVVGPRLTAGYPDRTVVPVRVADPAAAALLRAGDRVDLIAGDPSNDGTGRTVAATAVVVTVPAGHLDAAASGPSGRLILVAVPDDDAADVALAGLTGLLSVTWVD